MARRCRTRKHLTKHHSKRRSSKRRRDSKGKKHLHVKVEVKHRY